MNEKLLSALIITYLLVVLVWLFFLAGQRDNMYMYVGECVHAMNKEQSEDYYKVKRLNLTPSQAWNAYAEECIKNYYD